MGGAGYRLLKASMMLSSGVRHLAAAIAVANALLCAGAAWAAEEGGEEAGGLPQFDFSSWPTQLFWLIVAFVVLYYVMAQVALPRGAEVLETRQSRIEQDLERAGELKVEHDKVSAAVEATLGDARAKAEEQIDRAMEKAEKDAKKKQSQAETKLSKQQSDAEKRIAAAKAEAMDSVAEAAGEIAESAVERLLGKKADKRKLNAAVKAVAKAQG